MTTPIEPRSPFYRVAIKALVKNEQDKLLVTQSADGLWEIPGGGWEHDEDLRTCLGREILEELGVEIGYVGPVRFVYKGLNKKGYMAVKFAVDASLVSEEFTSGDDMIAARFVTKDELLALPMADDEAPIKGYADELWP